MKSINKCTLLGAVGKDPETRYTAEGLCVCSFSLATSEKRKDKDELVQWHNCVAFGKLGEIIEKYVTKGSKLYLDGTIQYQTYEKDGEKRYATKIIVNDVSFLGSGNQNAKPDTQKARGSDKKPNEPVDEFDDDDIPF